MSVRAPPDGVLAALPDDVLAELPGAARWGLHELDVWRVVGGEDKGGILVRKDSYIGSEKEKERLSTGALVLQHALEEGRLQYRRLSGTGPDTGWVTLRLLGKVLLERAYLRREVEVARPPPKVPALAPLPAFHTLGDSHCLAGWPQFVIPHRKMGLLCYNVRRLDLADLNPPVEPGDALCFCVGEIDCRAHVAKHCVGARTYQDVIDEIIEQYFDFLKTLPEEMNLRIFVYNVIPPVRSTQHAREDEAVVAAENAEVSEEERALVQMHVQSLSCPVSDEERLAYVLYFNSCLKAECAKADYTFFDVYAAYADEDGFLVPFYTNDDLHISDGWAIGALLEQLGPWANSCEKRDVALTIDKFFMGFGAYSPVSVGY